MCQMVISPHSGSHEHDCPGNGSLNGNMDSGGECGVLAETMFYVPALVVKLLWPRVLMSAGVVTAAMHLWGFMN
jgi:hypothetical protein